MSIHNVVLTSNGWEFVLKKFWKVIEFGKENHVFFVFCFFLLRFKCRRCVNNIETRPPPEGSDCTNDISQWHHCASPKGLVDTVLKRAWDVGVSFVFHQKSHDQISTVWVVVVEGPYQETCLLRFEGSRKLLLIDDERLLFWNLVVAVKGLCWSSSRRYKGCLSYKSTLLIKLFPF